MVLNVKTRRVAGSRSRVTNLPTSMPMHALKAKKSFNLTRFGIFTNVIMTKITDFRLISIHNREGFSVLLSPTTPGLDPRFFPAAEGQGVCQSFYFCLYCNVFYSVVTFSYEHC